MLNCVTGYEAEFLLLPNWEQIVLMKAITTSGHIHFRAYKWVTQILFNSSRTLKQTLFMNKDNASGYIPKQLDLKYKL